MLDAPCTSTSCPKTRTPRRADIGERMNALSGVSNRFITTFDMPTTSRSKTAIWFISFPADAFSGTKLPIHGDVRCVLKENRGRRVSKSAGIAKTADHLVKYWGRAGIPTPSKSGVMHKRATDGFVSVKITEDQIREAFTINVPS